MKQRDVLQIIGAYGARVDAPARKLFSRNSYKLYGMMRYFMGYADSRLNNISVVGGKRFRPGLTLVIAESYERASKALPVAVSVEVFHNFTLIHDDIIDNDTVRRGRPTVWKLWGTGHAINTGDAQLVLAFKALEDLRISEKDARRVRDMLLKRYLDVIEGQYLDFTLAEARLNDKIVSVKEYLRMTNKKTAQLVRAATEAGGIAVGRSEREVRALGAFGENLGMAYQLFDDWQSIWGDPKKTGKVRAGDILERKKTLPVIYTRDHLARTDATRLTKLYDGAKHNGDIKEILALFEKVGARDELERVAGVYKKRALKALSQTTLNTKTRHVLECLTRTLIPDTVVASR